MLTNLGFLSPVRLTFITATAMLLGYSPLLAAPPKPGTVKGTVRASDGRKVQQTPGMFGENVQLQLFQGKSPRAQATAQNDDSFSFPKVEPGVYDVHVNRSLLDASPHTPYAPVFIYGVLVRPAGETELSIVLHQGKTLEVRGVPYVTNPSELKTGWLRGRLMTPAGDPLYESDQPMSADVLLFQNGRLKTSVTASCYAQGLYIFDALAPGTYDIHLRETRSDLRNDGQTQRLGKRVFKNVRVRQGELAWLDIVVSPGTEPWSGPAPSPKYQPLKLVSR